MAAKKSAPETPKTELTDVDLKKLIDRRHPEYAELKEHWDFCELAYRGGRKWFEGEENLFKFYKEGQGEYDDRKKRTYRANHTKRVVDTVTQYLFRESPHRKDAPGAVIEKFWERATVLGGTRDINRFMREVDQWTSVFGRVYIVVDRMPDDGATITRQRKDESSPYAYIVFPQRVMDFSIGTDGEFNWVLISEDYRDDTGLSSSGKTLTRYRLWTRTSWYLIGRSAPDKEDVAVLGSGSHGLDRVPVIAHSDTDGTAWSSPALAGDIVYMDRTLVNYGSMLDEILYEQTFSQLTMPAEGLIPGAKESNQLIAAAKNRIFLYSATSPGAKPEYISPDASQASLIIEAMATLKKDIYAVTGTDAGDANSSSMSKGREYASGKVRQFDHAAIENLLLGKARALEDAEERIAAMVDVWMGGKGEIDESLVTYPDKFDVRGLAAELDIASQLFDLTSPVEVMRHQMRHIVAKTFPRLDEEEAKAIDESINAWQPQYQVDQKLAGDQLAVDKSSAESQQQVAEAAAEASRISAEAAKKNAEKPTPAPVAPGSQPKKPAPKAA